ncbi:MAG: chromate resistance protein [Planctomycetota bacterium]
MKWVTWENVGVDRIGCAWLIRKWIDPRARFFFIPRGGTLPDNAEAFDIPGARFTHHGGHCSFDALVKHYRLNDPILARMARIIDEADTIQEINVEPTASGLDWICEGIRLISDNDETAIQQGALVFDALYARLAADRPIASS